MDNDRLTGPGPSGGGGYDAALLDHWLAGRTRVDARSRRGLPRSLLPQSLSPIIKPLPAGRFRVHESNAEMRWEVMRGQGYVVPNADFFAAQQGQAVPGTPWRLGAIGVAAWRGAFIAPSRSGAPSNSNGTRVCPRTRSTCSPGGPGRAADPSPAPRSAPMAGGAGIRRSLATPGPRRPGSGGSSAGVRPARGHTRCGPEPPT